MDTRSTAVRPCDSLGQSRHGQASARSASRVRRHRILKRHIFNQNCNKSLIPGHERKAGVLKPYKNSIWTPKDSSRGRYWLVSRAHGYAVEAGLGSKHGARPLGRNELKLGKSLWPYLSRISKYRVQTGQGLFMRPGFRGVELISHRVAWHPAEICRVEDRG